MHRLHETYNRNMFERYNNVLLFVFRIGNVFRFSYYGNLSPNDRTRGLMLISSSSSGEYTINCGKNALNCVSTRKIHARARNSNGHFCRDEAGGTFSPVWRICHRSVAYRRILVCVRNNRLKEKRNRVITSNLWRKMYNATKRVTRESTRRVCTVCAHKRIIAIFYTGLAKKRVGCLIETATRKKNGSTPYNTAAVNVPTRCMCVYICTNID